MSHGSVNLARTHGGTKVYMGCTSARRRRNNAGRLIQMGDRHDTVVARAWGNGFGPGWHPGTGETHQHRCLWQRRRLSFALETGPA